MTRLVSVSNCEAFVKRSYRGTCSGESNRLHCWRDETACWGCWVSCWPSWQTASPPWLTSPWPWLSSPRTSVTRTPLSSGLRSGGYTEDTLEHDNKISFRQNDIWRLVSAAVKQKQDSSEVERVEQEIELGNSVIEENIRVREHQQNPAGRDQSWEKYLNINNEINSILLYQTHILFQFNHVFYFIKTNSNKRKHCQL